MTHIGPHSRPGKLAVIDGRSAEARLMKAIRDDLTAHVGGNPTVAERMLIGRIAMLMLRMHLMDARALKNGDDTERDAKQYLAWNAAVARMLRQIGLKGATGRAQTLTDYLAANSEAAAA